MRPDYSKSGCWRLAASVLLGLGCGYCSQSDSASTTTDTPSASDDIIIWALVVQPDDLSTDMADSDVILAVLPALNSTHKVPISLLEAVAAVVSVHDDMGGLVPITTEVLPPRVVEHPVSFDDPVDISATGAILVKGHEPWSQTWHTLRLGDLPERFDVFGFRPIREGDTGYEMRFAPHAIAILQSVTYCPGSDSSGTLSAQFSQPMNRDESDAIAIATHEAVQACTVRPNSAHQNIPARVIFFDCLPELTDFTLAVDSPLVAVDGKQATLLDGRATFTIAWPSDSWLPAPKQGPDCMLWQE